MKSTDENLFPCEQNYAHKARLASQAINDCKQEETDKQSDDAAFWKAVYILTHVAAILVVLTTLYRMWGQ